MSFKEFKVRVSPASASILEARLPCRSCGQLTSGRIFVALGSLGGTKVKSIKTAEAELPICELCKGG
ncbi:MAG: hypothetical protein V3U52_05275 [Thermoplasmata archaeon]